jgi:hypothetical protein
MVILIIITMELAYEHKGDIFRGTIDKYSGGFFYSGNNKFRRKCIIASSVSHDKILQYILDIFSDKYMCDKTEFLSFFIQFSDKSIATFTKYMKNIFREETLQNKIEIALKIIEKFTNNDDMYNIVAGIRKYLHTCIRVTDAIQVIYWRANRKNVCDINSGSDMNTFGYNLDRAFALDEYDTSDKLYIIDRFMQVFRDVKSIIDNNIYVKYSDIFYLLEELYNMLLYDSHVLYRVIHTRIFDMISCNPYITDTYYINVMTLLNNKYNIISRQYLEVMVTEETCCDICYENVETGHNISMMHPSKDTKDSAHFMCSICISKYSQNICPFCRRPIEYISRELLL